MEKASGDFVKSLRKEIELKKQIQSYDRNLLEDSLDFVLSYLIKRDGIELRSLKNFKTNELSSIASIFVDSENPLDLISEVLSELEFHNQSYKIGDTILVSRFDLSDRIPGYRKKNNSVLVQFLMKGKHIVEMKISINQKDLSFSIYESNYFFLKIWIFYKNQFFNERVAINSQDRSREEITRSINEKLTARIFFYPNGDFKQINISPKRERKS